ncbi:hypothetical protein MBLNU457_5290t1 [Dothideomycetes sp. NU457]
MASPQKPKQGSRWGSLLSGAVSGLESRLDTLLAEEPDASAKSRAAEKAALEAGPRKAVGDGTTASRDASRSRVNDRLQERLARAMASRAGSQAPSGTASPAPAGSTVSDAASPRTSIDSRPSMDLPKLEVADAADSSTSKQDGEPSMPDQAEVVAKAPPEPTGTLLTSGLPINPARISIDSMTRPSIEISEPDTSVDSSVINGSSVTAKTTAELEAEIAQMRADHEEAERSRQEDLHAHMERIDALQAKLQYLAKETVAAAKEANASTSGSLQEKLAEKDERIALLMEEGEGLSKKELRNLTTIKKLTAKMRTDEKALSDTSLKYSKLEQSEKDLRQRLSRLEQSERQNSERLKRLTKAEADLQAFRMDADTSRTTIASLRKQLDAAEAKTQEALQQAQNSTSLADSKKVADLQEELENARIERNLAKDRASAELRRVKEEHQRQLGSASSVETELKAEIQNLESRMETLRLRAEEASSDAGGDTQAKLLRQIETLQTQYSLAAENWRTIEGSLNARMTAVEKERDEANKREGDVRKKARELASRSRKLEEELEAAQEQSRTSSGDVTDQRGEIQKLQTRLEASEKALEEAKADFDRQRKVWEAETNQRGEEEKTRQSLSAAARGQSGSSVIRGSQHPVRRKPSRLFSADSSGSLTADSPFTRRSSNVYSNISRRPTNPDINQLSPSISRQESAASFANLNGSSMPPTPFLQTPDVDMSSQFDPDNDNDSPGRTVNDVISASTVHTGPSVQLVERMSSSIRRLEAEKAAHRDEMARLQTQRDEARDQLVGMMREVEALETASAKEQGLERELLEVRNRYNACLEMMGEREEEVAELKDDLAEMKRVYRELAETMGKT